MNAPARPHRSGFVAVVGRPSTGKSSLLNTALGQLVAPVSPRPQTTRRRQLGILTRPHAQIIFVDTPGLHKAKSPLAMSMVNAAREVLSEVDAVMLLVDAESGIRADDLDIIASLMETGTPVIAVINKIDAVRKEDILPMIEELSRLFPFKEIVPVSAIKNFNVERLEQVIAGYLPEGPQLFPEDMITHVSERFIAAEIVREKVTLRKMGTR